VKNLPVGVVCRGQYGILDFSEESRMRFEKFRNVHEDQLLVGILDTDQATEEILFEHVQNFNVIALCINLVETLYKVLSLSSMLKQTRKLGSIFSFVQWFDSLSANPYVYT
jgi:hypothetical protein